MLYMHYTHYKKYINTCIHTSIHTYMHTYIHTYIHASMHTCIHTYTFIYIHTYIHVHVYMFSIIRKLQLGAKYTDGGNTRWGWPVQER